VPRSPSPTGLCLVCSTSSSRPQGPQGVGSTTMKRPLERDCKRHMLFGSDRASVVKTHAPLSVRQPDDCRPRKRHVYRDEAKPLVCCANGFAVNMPSGPRMPARRFPPPRRRLHRLGGDGAGWSATKAARRLPMSISRMSGPTSGSQSYSHPIRRARSAAYSKEAKIAKAVSIAAGPY
jgi:hypothetical protein